MKCANLYHLIGVAHDAEDDDIRIACEQLLKSDAEHSKKVAIRHARDVLSNRLTRVAYDNSLINTPIGKRERTAPASRIKPYQIACIFVALVAVVGGWNWNDKAKKAEKSQQAIPQIVPNGPGKSKIAALPELSAGPLARSGSAGVYAEDAPSVMLILSLGPDEQPIASGSGVVIAPETVVTNCHVVVKTAYVIVRDGDVDYPATSKTSDRMFDLCLLSVPTLTAKEVKIGSVNNVHVGEPVYAIGAPHGQQRTLSEGNVSALLDGPDGPIIQSTAVIAPGSSGGGLFSADGRLVGITTAQSRASNLVNLAVPIDWLDKLESR